MLTSITTRAQQNGIQFEKNLKWEEVQKQAKKQNKYIFLDCYTTWCAPCKYMNDSLFTKAEVGEFFNQHFVNARLQLDTTKNDDVFTRQQYASAHNILEQYKIKSYPAYLFFGPDGNIIHRAVGATSDPKVFIDKAKDALNRDKQYYTLLEKYGSGTKDSAMIKYLAIEAHEFGDDEMSASLVNEYFQLVANIYDRENLSFIGQLTKRSTDKGFEIYLQHAKSVDSVIGKYQAERKIMNIIMGEDSNILAANQKALAGLDYIGTINGKPQYGRDPGKPLPNQLDPDWKAMRNGIQSKYGSYYADRLVTWTKIGYYNRREKWGDYVQNVILYVENYRDDISVSQLNSFAWDVFIHSESKKELTAALEWSKENFDETKNSSSRLEFIDTYANLLYKTGQTSEAINYEEMAVRIAVGDDKDLCIKTLEKMKKGLKTWD